MTTSEFIKILQEADPSGQSHMRINGEVPWFAERKEGYWDGPYNYINEKGQWVHSTKGDKIDIHSKSREDLVDEVVGGWNPFTESPDGLWEKVKEKFVFETSYVNNQGRIDEFMKPLREHYDWHVEYRKDSWTKHLQEVIELHGRGCRFFRKKEVGSWVYYQGWEFINKENPKDIGSPNLAHTYPILKSDKFISIETDYFPRGEYFEYVLK